MNPGDIVFDVETKKSFDDVGGKDHMEKLGISVIGAFVYGENLPAGQAGKYIAYEEHELPEFEKLLKTSGRVIGFNIHHFDLPVLQPYMSFNLKELSTLDLMNDVEKSAGFRISLDNLCGATFGHNKSSNGMQAIYWYREGKIEEIKKYCIKDVELTKDLFEYGAKNGQVFFNPRNAPGKVALSVGWGNAEVKNIRKILKQGLEEKRSIELEYITKPEASAEAVSRRLVDIYRMKGDSFEGYCHLRKAERVFKIDRITDARLTNNEFKLITDVQGSIF
ncbi:ribonuclease H-like domain-containing protein [Candidatus Giovannonibacteria bacterium]|nr:ribonuclease H-like domain-containing protein [Candidatus Giovannonibacteria bacterium]